MTFAVRVKLRNFKLDRRGVSAVEFALLSPLMIGLYLGSVEISEGIGIDRKVTLTTGAIANLSAQVTNISSEDMKDIMKAGAAIMAPYSTAPLKITISCLNIDTKKKVSVKWSRSEGGTARAVGSSVAVDSDLIPEQAASLPIQLLLSEVSYDYAPAIGYSITGAINLSDKMYMSPRMSAPAYGDGASAKACT